MKLQICIVVFGILVSGCASHKVARHTVHVIDARTHQPLPNAEVTVLYNETNSAPRLTDIHGTAYFPDGFGPVEQGIHVQVQTTNWQTVVDLDYTAPRPITITVSAPKS